MQLSKITNDIRDFSEWLFEGCAKQRRTLGHLGTCVEARLHDGHRKTHQPAGMKLAGDPDEADAIRQRINRAHLAEWSDRDVLDRLHEVARQAIPDAVALLIDDTGIEKKGDKSPGVQRQYTGTAGKVSNCQIVVSTHWSSHEASMPLEMDLYMPKSWCEDPVRRAEAWIPEELVFRTKPQIALGQVEAICGSGNAPQLVLADASYGDDTSFRDALRGLGLDYALGISKTLKVWRPGEGPDPPAPPSGKGRPPTLRFPGTFQPVEVGELAMELADEDWEDVDLRPGQRDPRRSRFARIRVRHAHRAVAGKPPGAEEWLVVEWPEDEKAPTHYYLCTLDEAMPLAEMAILAKLRWRVERDYQDAKQQIGLHHYEGRRYTGFKHHLTICTASMAYLAASRSLFPPQEPAVRR